MTPVLIKHLTTINPWGEMGVLDPQYAPCLKTIKERIWKVDALTTWQQQQHYTAAKKEPQHTFFFGPTKIQLIW